MLVSIGKMAKNLRDCLRQFENAPLEAQYCSTKDIASSLIFARQLLITLEQRAELIEAELAPPSPDYKRAYEIATEGVLLSSGSVHTLISECQLDPIRWTKLGPTVKDIVQKLDYAFAGYGRKKQFKSRVT